ncbi:MAG: exo-beta-N-acetylmuramidase NamZ domain-containing protein [Saprospiraceae bacterium]
MRPACLFFCLFFLSATCQNQPAPTTNLPAAVVVGAAQFEVYLPQLTGRRVALVVNHSSLVGQAHLADTLLKQGVQITKIFAPEHGFRGTADAGKTVENGLDTRTGLPVFSLYGKKKKPSPTDLADVDVVVFFIKDVGARFYTYISTLFHVLEACAENHKPCLVLDRPNPNGHFVDGPVLEPGLESFVGIAPLPVVHGCTVGELARMFVGEGWLNPKIDSAQSVDLQIVPCQNYTHQTAYELPVRPSPNLPNLRAVYLYPSLCLFEGTVVSLGRGTDAPFQIIGYPDHPDDKFQFTPAPNEGNQLPLYQGKICRGEDLRGIPLDSLRQLRRLDLSYLLRFYEKSPDQRGFFLSNHFFDKLAGTATLQAQIMTGKTEAEIRQTWQPGLEKYKAMRQQYLLYPD